jgi:transcriptional regulator with XRE-family HTH domain
MQAISVKTEDEPYNAALPMGRPAKNKRSELGERIAALRERAGLSQEQLAQKVGSNQKNVAYWERHAVSLKPAQIGAIAAALGCSHQEILGVETPKARGSGPVGKAKALFDRVSALPRDRQQRILTTVEDMLVAHETRKAS